MVCVLSRNYLIFSGEPRQFRSGGFEALKYRLDQSSKKPGPDPGKEIIHNNKVLLKPVQVPDLYIIQLKHHIFGWGDIITINCKIH